MVWQRERCCCLGVQQIAGAATAAADQPERRRIQTDVAKAACHERRATGRRYRGNIYGSQGVVAHAPAPAAAGTTARPAPALTITRIATYRGRDAVSRGYYGASARYRPQYYAHRYYPARARPQPTDITAQQATTRRYYARRYYPTRPGRKPTHTPTARRPTTRNTMRVAITRPGSAAAPGYSRRGGVRGLPAVLLAVATIRPNPSELRSAPPIFLHQPIGAPAVLTAGSAPAAALVIAAFPSAVAGLPAITKHSLPDAVTATIIPELDYRDVSANIVVMAAP